MFEYLQKYNNLPKDLRDKVSSPDVLSFIEKLESEYGVDLAVLIMKVMTKDIDVSKLSMAIVSEFGLDEQSAKSLSDNLINKVFHDVKDYLGIISEAKPSFARDDSLPSFEKEKKSGLFLSQEDEEEIQRFSQKIEKNDFSSDNLDQKVDQVIQEANISFTSRELSERFRKILTIYFKGIRDKIETRQTMMKPLDGGGLSLQENDANRVIGIAQKISSSEIKPVFTPPEKIKIPEEEKILPKKDFKESFARDADYDLSQLKKPATDPLRSNISQTENKEKGERKQQQVKNKPEPPKDLPVTDFDLDHEIAPPSPSIIKEEEEPKIRPVEKKKVLPQDLIDFDHELVPPAPVLKTEKSKKENQKPEKPEEKKPEKLEKKVKFQTKQSTEEKRQFKETKKIDKSKKQESDNIQDERIIKTRKSPDFSSRKRMDDVKHVPRVMSPIDELRYLNLVNFRRMSSNPAEAVKKISHKLDLLEEEKYSKRLEGIKAWRQSPINRLYLKIGSLSIEKNRSVEEIIGALRKKGSDHLSVEEFQAIMDLNKTLRY